MAKRSSIHLISFLIAVAAVSIQAYVPVDNATFSLENNSDGMIFSHLLRVAGKGDKTGGMLTLLPVNADQITSANGSLRIMVLDADNWPELFETIFADPRNKP